MTFLKVLRILIVQNRQRRVADEACIAGIPGKAAVTKIKSKESQEGCANSAVLLFFVQKKRPVQNRCRSLREEVQRSVYCIYRQLFFLAKRLTTVYLNDTIKVSNSIP